MYLGEAGLAGDYARGWDDCLDVVICILRESKDIEEALKRIEYLQSLVKEKKFERIKVELGVLSDVF